MRELYFPDSSGGIILPGSDQFLVTPEGRRCPLVISHVALLSIRGESGDFYLVRRGRNHPYAPGKFDMLGQDFHRTGEINPEFLVRALADHIGFSDLEIDSEPLGTHRRVQLYRQRDEYRDTERTFMMAFAPGEIEKELVRIGGLQRFTLDQIQRMRQDGKLRRPELFWAMYLHDQIVKGEASPGLAWYDPAPHHHRRSDDLVAVRYLAEAMRAESS